MNILNDIYLDTYILQTIFRQKLEKLTNILKQNLILKIYNFQSKLEIFGKLKKRSCVVISVFCYEIKKKYPTYFQKTCLFFIDGRRKQKILHSCQLI